MSAKRHKELDADGVDLHSGSERQCAVTRAVLAPDALIRFVQAPDGAIVPDLERRLPGRGVWLTPHRDIVEKAVRTKAFARSLKTDVRVPEGLGALVDALMLRRVVDAVSLANKAGLAIAGFQQVESGLEKANVAVLLHGSDAAADGKGKLDRKFKAIQAALDRPAPIVDVLTIAEISLAMGRPSVVHAALLPGGLSERFLREAERLARYRTPDADAQVSSTTIRTEG